MGNSHSSRCGDRLRGISLQETYQPTSTPSPTTIPRPLPSTPSPASMLPTSPSPLYSLPSPLLPSTHPPLPSHLWGASKLSMLAPLRWLCFLICWMRVHRFSVISSSRLWSGWKGRWGPTQPPPIVTDGPRVIFPCEAAGRGSMMVCVNTCLSATHTHTETVDSESEWGPLHFYA